MEKDNYTLDDPVFRYGLVRGADSERAFSDDRKVMVVGGASTQLITRDKPLLLRPTNDIDFITNKPSSKKDRRDWAKYVSEKTMKEGHNTEGGLNRHGSEVRFSNLKTDLLLHLDCFGPNFYNRHKYRLDAEYERARNINFGGSKVRCHAPLDIIANKVRRILALNKNGAHLNSSQKEFLELIKGAQFDDINSEEYSLNLSKLIEFRMKNIEDLGRSSYSEVISQIQGYKVQKDIYDICSVIGACRRRNDKIPNKEFKSALELALRP